MKLILVVAVGLLANHAQGTKVKSIDDFGQSLREFTGFMYHTLASSAGEADNIFFSPLSVSQTLGMVMVGSRGKTFDDIETALMVHTERNYTETNYRKLFKKIYNKVFNVSRGHTSAKSLMANRMYVLENYPIRSDYKHDLETFFDASVVPTNFDDPHAAADMINDWVANKTDNLIRDLMDSDSIEPATRLVLVNALFFKAAWKYETLGKGLKQRLFHTPGTVSDYRVAFMKQKGNIRYNYNEGFNMVQVAIPYEDDEAYLLIMMPTEKDGMKKLTRNSASLSNYLKDLPSKVPSWRNDMKTVRWPKFSIDKTMDMKVILKSMGVRDLFKIANADLSGITAQESLYVSVFKHRAKVIVDEAGTTAAAASALGILARTSFRNVIDINQPFLFAIVYQGHFLFFGRVSDPNPEK